MGQGTKPRVPPGKPESMPTAPLPASRNEASFRRSAPSRLAADGSQQNRTEIGIRMEVRSYRVEEWPKGCRRLSGLKNRGHDGDGNRSIRGLGVNCRWSRSTVECGKRQIDERQHHNQQHDKNHAAEDVQHRRPDLPLRHVRTVLPEFGPEVNPLKEPPGKALAIVS